VSPARATARLGARTAVAPEPRRGEQVPDDRPELRVVPETRRRKGVGVVVFLAGVALFGSLFGLAVFHTMLVQSQSTLDDLDARITEARAHREELRLDIADLEAPDRILDEAREQGMVPADDVVVLEAGSTAPAGATGDEPPASDAAPDEAPAGDVGG